MPKGKNDRRTDLDLNSKQASEGQELKLRTKSSSLGSFSRTWELYVMLLVPMALLIIFNYVPMYFLIIAFKNFTPKKGAWGSAWVGLKYFKLFFDNPMFGRVLKNTISIGLYGYILGNVAGVALAFAMNEINHRVFKKTAQMITYAPYFLSTVVIVGMLIQFTDYYVGPINALIKLAGGEPVQFLANPDLFASLVVWSGVWQGVGYSSVVYLAALSGIDPSLHEAAVIDGSSRLQMVRYIDIPCIAGVIAIMVILSSPGIIAVGYEKIYLMQNALNISKSEIISTYIYKQGLGAGQYSYATVVGLFNSVVSLLFILTADRIAKWISPGSGVF
jgi:putative aldouronate transport system permease protein